MLCYHVSDLHGRTQRYDALFTRIRDQRPDAVFIGGDIFAHSGFGLDANGDILKEDFLHDYLAVNLLRLKEELGVAYPAIFIILGNDDPRTAESEMIALETSGIWRYIHNKRVEWRGYDVYGYAIVPPTPFLRKDWEKYDVSRFVDPGCISPEDGKRSVDVNPHEIRYGTIKQDLEKLTGDRDLSKSIFLFHTPPYKSALDRAALDGKTIDHVPLDVHVGSIAVQRFIRDRQPLVTLHGHIHESTRLTGEWRDTIGDTAMFNAAHHGPELCLVKFNPEHLDVAGRELF